MSDLFKHDNRIEENTALRDLEKKVHWLMYQLSKAGLTTDLSGNKLSIPADCNSADIENDAITIMMNANSQGVVAGSNRLLSQHQKLIKNTIVDDIVEDDSDESE
jgi:hypothetical protein